MAARRDPPPSRSTVPTAAWNLPASTASISSARHHADRWLASSGASAEESRDVALVVSELVTNAVRASQADDTVQLELAATDDGWAITVRDRGEGFVPSTTGFPADPLAVGGRGLPVVSTLAGPLSVERDAQGWNVVRTALLGQERRAITSAGSGRSDR
jgi:anti-sigma regulatory factor (Ser/Thr protein kinase)